MSIVILYGQERFLINEKIRLAIEKTDNSDMNVSEFSCFDREALQALYTMPFLGDYRLVLIRGKFKDLVGKVFLEYLEDISSSSHLILISEDKPDGRSKVFKSLSKNKHVKIIRLDKLDEEGLKAFIAARMSCALEADVMDYLIAHIGYLIDDKIDLYRVINECAKLDSISGVVDVSHINALIDRSVSATIFELIDSIVLNQPEKAFLLVDHFLQDENAFLAFSMLVRQFRISYKIQAGATCTELDMNSYAYKKIASTVSNDMDYLEALQLCIKASSDVKAGIHSKEDSLRLLLVLLFSLSS